MLMGKELLYLMQDEIRDRKRFKKAFAWEYVLYWKRSEIAWLKSYLFLLLLMLKYRKLNEQMMPIAAMNHIMTISGKGLIISSIFLLVWSIGGRLPEGECKRWNQKESKTKTTRPRFLWHGTMETFTLLSMALSNCSEQCLKLEKSHRSRRSWPQLQLQVSHLIIHRWRSFVTKFE